MKRKWNRFIGILLCCAMLLGMLPMTAQAELGDLQFVEWSENSIGRIGMLFDQYPNANTYGVKLYTEEGECLNENYYICPAIKSAYNRVLVFPQSVLIRYGREGKHNYKFGVVARDKYGKIISKETMSSMKAFYHKQTDPVDGVRWDGETATWNMADTKSTLGYWVWLYRDGECVAKKELEGAEKNRVDFSEYMHDYGAYSFMVSVIPQVYIEQELAELCASIWEESDIIYEGVKTLKGGIALTSGAIIGQQMCIALTGYAGTLDRSVLHFQWRVKEESGWTDIENGQISNYVPTKDMLGKEISLKITADDHEGSLVSTSLVVSKQSTCKKTEPIVLKAVKPDYTSFVIENFSEEQDYVVRSAREENKWTIDWEDQKITADTVTDLTPDKIYYVYTRYKETDICKASVGVTEGSILLQDERRLAKVKLEGYTDYGPGNTIFIPVNTSKTIKISKDPLNANMFWFTFKSPASTDLYSITDSVTGQVAVDCEMPESITLKAGSTTGYGTLGAYYNDVMYNYGTWQIRVYDPENIDSVTVITSPIYEDITLNVGDSYTPEKQDVLLGPEEANEQYHYEWRVCTTSNMFGNYYSGTENQYISVDAKTGTVTALQSTKDATGYDLNLASVALCAVKGTSYNVVSYYKIQVNEENVEADDVTLPKKSLRLCPGEVAPLSVVLNPVNTTEPVVWERESGSENITVSKTGLVTVLPTAAIGETAVIKVSCGAKYATCKVTVTEFEDPYVTKLPFTDVPEDAWFYDYVKDVYDRGLMTGLSETLFGPSQDLARAQFAVILYRMEGAPETEYGGNFPDVPEGTWYTDAVAWAVENGIVTGYTSTGTFGPSDKITREQMAVMMYRYAKYKSCDVSEMKELGSFPDAGTVSPFAEDALKWCTAAGIISGDGQTGMLMPQGNTNRAVCATIISRYIKNIE